jgi:hypothetical protein
MRADIHDGPEHMLQSEAGYIDARPLTPARQNLLQRTAGPYIRVKSDVLTVSRLLPVYPDQRTFSELARREAGEALTDIARTFGVSHTTIGRLTGKS